VFGLQATPDGGALIINSDGRLRRLLPAGTAVNAAAFGQDAYVGAAGGRTTIVTTRPGRATVTVRSARTGKVVRTATSDVPAGASELRFRRLPETDVTETLRFAPTGGAPAATDRIAVSTRTVLTMRRARGALESRLAPQGGGDDATVYGLTTGRCARRTKSRVVCQVRNFEHDNDTGATTTSCSGKATVLQRADGVRVEEADGCRL
jgi:hypothetical protein